MRCFKLTATDGSGMMQAEVAQEQRLLGRGFPIFVEGSQILLLALHKGIRVGHGSTHDVIAAVDIMNAAGDVGCFGAREKCRIGANFLDACELMRRCARGGLVQ